MAGIINKSLAQIYKDLFYIDNSNTGFTTSIKEIKDGAGNVSSLGLSTRHTRVTPNTDTTTTFQVTDKDGNALFTVDSTNDLVKAGINQAYSTTQYATFYSKALNVDGSNHIAVSRTENPTAVLNLGTGTNPDTSLTISTNADDVLSCLWYVDSNIVLDSITCWVGAHASGNDTLRFHLMSYDIDNGNGVTGGDLSNGVVIADGADISSVGYEQAYYQALTISTASVVAGKALFLTLKGDSSNADYVVNCQIKYHL
jgi:hypothetical protein